MSGDNPAPSSRPADQRTIPARHDGTRDATALGDSSERRIPHVRIAMAVGVALVAVLALLALGEGESVHAIVVDDRAFAPTLTVRGRLDAAHRATVAAEMPGRIETVLVRAGDSVAAGDPLLRFDANMAREQYRAAAALATSARDGVRSASADLASAEVQRRERQADFERVEPLGGTAVPAADVSAARAALEKAQAEVERAHARVAQAESQAAAAAADRDLARRALDDLVLRAPFAGIIVARDAHPGDVVGAGTPLLHLADPASLEVVAYVDESVMGSLTVGSPATITFLSDVGETANGIVTSIGREVEPDTREVELWIALPDPPERWAIGQRVDVRIEAMAGKASTAVPTEMVSWQGREAGVFVVEGGRARWVPIELGRADREHVEIARGVSVGDTILAPTGLRAGARVDPLLVVVERGP